GAGARPPLTEILALLGKGWRRPVEGRASIPLRLQPQLLQPSSQLERRNAVVPVVRLHCLQDLGAQRRRGIFRDRIFDRPKIPGCLPKLDLASQTVEGFQLLDRVAVDSRPKSFADHAVKVDEDAAA